MTKSNDLLLFNGSIYTMDAANPKTSALLMIGGKVFYTGDDAKARDLAGFFGVRNIVDLKGAAVLPGLSDAHLHLEFITLGLDAINAEQPTKADVLKDVSKMAAGKPAGSWITGFGYNHNVWDGKPPTAADLDPVSPDHPVCLESKSGHSAWVNSAALRMAGITANTPDPAGGEIVRKANGEPEGTLLEEAVSLVKNLIPKPSIEQLTSDLRRTVQQAHKAGLTGVHDMDTPRIFQAEQILHKQGELTLRVNKSIPLDYLDHALALGLRSGLGDDMLRIGSVKMFADGAMGPRTAWMLEGYDSAPENTGISTTPIEEISEAVFKANAAGLSTAIHAIGDRATREILDIYEEARQKNITGKLRNRIEHVQLLSPQDVDRLGKLGVIASMQPLHTTSDMDISDLHWGKRAVGAYTLKSQLKAGAVLALGSDCPVEVWNPLTGIHAAVTRRRADGTPGPEGWYPDERLSVLEAVQGYTTGPAYAAGLEDRLGQLKAGFLGDCVILDQDLFAIDPMEILNVSVLGTVVDGQFVWRAPALS
jgi:predicted amidohydrolase YtcJ